MLFPKPPPPKEGDYVDIFCRGTNALMKSLVLQKFRDKVDMTSLYFTPHPYFCVQRFPIIFLLHQVEMQPAGSAGPEILDKLMAPPEFPGEKAGGGGYCLQATCWLELQFIS